MTDDSKEVGLNDDEYDTLQENIEQGIQKGNDQYGYVGPRLLTVSEALRTKKGHVEIKGQIATVSSVYNMVSAVTTKCLNCKVESRKDYSKKPKYAPPEDKNCKCISCGEKGFDVTPEWVSVVDIELQDTEKFNDIERLYVKLFEGHTNDVGAGEIVSIVGNLDVAKKNESHGGKYITILYSESIEYTKREKTELTQQDIEDIEVWKQEHNQNLINALVEKFEPTVIGNGYVKKSLLLAGVNAGIKNDDNRDPKRLRINVLLVGDPSLAKSIMLRKIAAVIPNARYESAQGSTGLSLTFMITKEQGDAHVLRLGPIPLANGSLCAINEMGQMPLEQQKHFLDFMEEGWSTNNKYGINAHITGNTSLVGSANPRNGRWKYPNEIELDEIPVLTQIIDRLDIICILRETEPDEQKDREYVSGINEIRRNSKARHYFGYDEFIKKYLMYARTFNPDAEISEDGLNMINEYWIKMGQRGITGRPRKLETLKRISVAISKLKLKNEADIDDVTDAMGFYNVILMHFNQIIPISQRPKEVTYQELVTILRETPAYSISFRELAKTAGERNEQVKSYIGGDFNIETNWKLRAIYDELLNNGRIILIQQKPTVFKWKSERDNEQTIVKADNQASEVSDVSEAVEAGDHEKKYKHDVKSLNENDVGSGPTPSDTSVTSDSTYEHLIETEYLQSLGKTAYHCKEHPDKWDTDLKGLEISHFKPFHNNTDTGTDTGNVQ